jgi:hypothetical protein
MNIKTKERLFHATALAKETFGELALNQNPSIVGSILISMTVDDLCDSIRQENAELTECIYKSAGHIAE